MVGWARFVRVVLTGFFGLVALLGGFVLLTNPYGNLPHLLFTEHFITDINQRFQYPAVVRSKQFDSAVIERRTRGCFGQPSSTVGLEVTSLIWR